MSRTSSRPPHPANPNDFFTMLCGQQVKVKNTFLDDVVREQSSNESTLVEAQTCPEFRNRKDGLSSSSASHSGASASVATHSDWLGDQELMPNTLQTLSTPPASLRYQVPNGCQADVVDFTDVIPRTPLELWHDQMKSQEALLCALQAMPDAPFRHLLSPPPPPYLGKIPGAINANLNAAASAAFSPLPNVPWAPVLSTIPPANEFLAPVEQVEGVKCGLEPGHEAGYETFEIPERPQPDACSGDVAEPGWSPKEKKNGKKKTVSKIWCHFFLDPTMLRHGFDVNKKVIGHGGANTKRIFEKTGAKIRLRGRGSGHNEGERGEAPVPLMLAVTSETRNHENFLYALEMSAQLLQTVTSKFPDFCRLHGHQGEIPQPLFWIGDASPDALASLELVSESRVLVGKTEVTKALDAAASPTVARSSRRGGY